MGKTLYIHSMAEELTKLQAMSTVTVTVPIHGPNLSTDNLIEALKDYMDNEHCVVHLDIAPNVSPVTFPEYMYILSMYVVPYYPGNVAT